MGEWAALSAALATAEEVVAKPPAAAALALALAVGALGVARLLVRAVHREVRASVQVAAGAVLRRGRALEAAALAAFALSFSLFSQ